MTVVVIGGSKGGTGKTTVAINLAVISVNEGKKTLLIDTDRQQTATDWVNSRDDKIDKQIKDGLIPIKRLPCIQKYGAHVHKEITSFRESYDHIIVDAGGFDSYELRSSMLAADRFYAPLKASQNDIWALSNLLEIIKAAKINNPNLIAKAFFNDVESHPNVKTLKEAQEAVNSEDENILEMSNITIRSRICFKTSIPKGRGITELERKDAKAIEEIMAVYNDIFNKE